MTQYTNSYLRNLSQIIRCHGTISDIKRVNVGVTQGSILGPILLYILKSENQLIYYNLIF